MLLDQLVQRRRGERASAGEELVEHEAERVDVAPRRHFAAEKLLGRHVGGRAGPDVFDGADRGEPEVHQADLAAAVEHHVRRLQIAVQHATFVGCREPRAQLAGDVGRLVFGKAADAAERRGQVLAVHQLHREKQLTVHLADVIDAADVRVRDLSSGSHLVVKLREADRVGGDGIGQELERDRLAEAEIVGAIHLAHAALAEQADDPVAAVENGAGREAAVTDGVGRGQPAVGGR